MKANIREAVLQDTQVLLYTDTDHSCKINFVTPEIVHIKYCFAPQVSPQHSFAVVAGSEKNDVKYLEDEQVLLPVVCCGAECREGTVVLDSGRTCVTVTREPFFISVRDAAGKLVHEDIGGRAYYRDENGRSNHTFALGGFDGFYGFGEKGGKLNKFKRRLRLYSCDTLGYDSELSDPLYKHIPFFIKRESTGGTVCGVFYDCTHSGVLDLGCERSGYWPPYAYLCADGGDIDYYIITGENVADIVRRYTLLTGTTALPTYQSLGYMASTMYYTEQDADCDQGIEHFIEELHRQGFACDGFHLSSGYTVCEGKRCVFHWNNERFPHPEAFFTWMQEHKTPVSPNVKPALLTTHPLYDEFAAAGAFLTNRETGKPYLERYWGGMASFVDFSSVAGREMWKKHLKRALFAPGAAALWNDNNEYEISSSGAQCENDGKPQAARTLKPVFANLMAKTGKEAMLEHNPDARPYLLSRAGYAGIQRYAQTWAGDNYTSWNNLKFNIPIMLGMGLSGVANQGCDIGGFQGSAPDTELFVRWVENGIFQPRFCIHSCNTDNTVTQPWSYPTHTPYVRAAFALRYALGLYLYSCMRASNTLGDPVMRPLLYDFAQDAAAADESFTFLFGPYLLVANVLEPGAVTRTVYLPKGVCWYDWHTHARYEGGTSVTVDAPMGKIPLFYRAGTILPMIEPAMKMQPENARRVKLLIEATQPCSFTLYQDDGCTNAYQAGVYKETAIFAQPQTDHVSLRFEKSGNGPELTEQYEIRLVCRTQAPLDARVGDTKLPVCLDINTYETADEALYFDMELRHALLKLRNLQGSFSVFVNYEIKDLIGM